MLPIYLVGILSPCKHLKDDNLDSLNVLHVITGIPF